MTSTEHDQDAPTPIEDVPADEQEAEYRARLARDAEFWEHHHMLRDRFGDDIDPA